MLTVIDLIRKLSIDIQEKYPKYKLQDRDINDTLDRPCSFIDLGSITCNMQANGYIRDDTEVELYFFCEDLETGFLELLDIKNEVMPYLSDGFIIDNDDGEEYFVLPSDLQAELFKADKALKITFNAELIQGIGDKSTEPNMEELHY